MARESHPGVLSHQRPQSRQKETKEQKASRGNERIGGYEMMIKEIILDQTEDRL